MTGIVGLDVDKNLVNYLEYLEVQKNYSSYTIVMYLNDLISMRNFGDAGAVSVILFIITGIFSIFVYKSMVKNDD